jgi:DNA primase
LAFPDRFLQELADRNDIVEVVSDYVHLTKRSGANQFGLCPFHSEKTPSFSVSQDKQIFHCFGCGKGGSVITFIMEIENLSFPDAVAFLARRAGMQMPEESHDADRGRRERMLELNRSAARFFYAQLIAPSGRSAQHYVDQRGISATMVRRFGLGFAPDSWDALTNAMIAKGFSIHELVDAGLAKHRQKGSGVYDTFRNRLMFPVIDVRGSVIGFSGRILGDGEPKYLNSPETLVFSKSRNLFALNLAKKSKSGYIILSEGNIDVISLHQAGFDSAVASLGTALTPEQARLISRYVSNVVIAYDNDSAGIKASQRAIQILEKLDLNVRVLQIDGAKDPDEFIKTRGADTFRALLEGSENHIEYQLQTIVKQHDLSTDDGKLAFLKEAVELVARLQTGVEREVYSLRVAEMAGVSADAVEADVERVRKLRFQQSRKKEERAVLRPASNAQPTEKHLRYENIRSATAEEGIVRLLYLDPGLFSGRDLPAPSDFSSDLLGRLYGELLDAVQRGSTISPVTLSEVFTPDEVAHLIRILQKPEELSNGERALSDYIQILQAEKLHSTMDSDLRATADLLRARKGYGV